VSIIINIKHDLRWNTREQVVLNYIDNNNSDVYDHIWDVLRQDVTMKVDDAWIKVYHEFIDEKNPLRYAID
jgi:hypothetical protein